MTDSEIATTLLSHLLKQHWPSIEDRVKIEVHLRSGKKYGRELFAAHEMTGQRVRLEWHLSPWEKDIFVQAAHEAFKASNEILRGLTSAATVSA